MGLVMCTLLAWAIICLIGAPSPDEIASECEGHGKVVAFDGGGFFDFSKGIAICEDGTVRVVGG